MNRQRDIADRLIELCRNDGLFMNLPENLSTAEIGDQDLRNCPWFDSMSLVFLQTLITEEWGIEIPESQFAAWFRTLNQIAAYIAEHRQQPGGTSSGRDGGGAGHAQEISRV